VTALNIADAEPLAERDTLPDGLFRYIAATSWVHQIPLVGLTVVVFLLEVVPLELQRRIVNDAVKNRQFTAVILLCATYVGAVLLQGTTKLGVNIYRAWVSEHAKRDLRRRICGSAGGGIHEAQARGTAVSMVVAEVEPVGNFIGSSVSEPLLQCGILGTVVTYVFHIDFWMGLAAAALFVPQMVFVPLMQHAMNRRTRAQVWLLRNLGAGLIEQKSVSEVLRPVDSARIDRVFQLDLRIFQLKYTMNFLMNLCTHAQVIAALLLGGWGVLNGQLEIGGVVAFISGIGRITDPWGDIVNYFRDLSVNEVKFKLLAGAINDPDNSNAVAVTPPA
jgi:ABC-type multidrug transport system fused ATPase/permease subunit